jgi:P-type Cu+ transporter
LKIDSVDNFKSITGKGVSATYKGKPVLIGNEKLMGDFLVTIDGDLADDVRKEQIQGKTVPLVAINGVFVGYVVISDAIKKSSQQAIEILQKKGIEVLMMTGDNQYTAKTVASKVGISNFEYDCLPQDKLNKVAKLKEEGKMVAMVGDGVNDAPALALADVGIAMGTGSDVAIESSEITLIKGDLQGIVKARHLSEKVMSNIKQNLFFALVYNTIGVPIAAGVLFPVFGILLSPMIAALAMSFSSVSVISNALRLKSVKIK